MLYLCADPGSYVGVGYALNAASRGSESCEVVLGDSGISSVLKPSGLEHCLFEDYFSPDTFGICFFQNDRAEIINRLCTAFFLKASDFRML